MTDIASKRCLTREHAAEYLDVSLSTFNAWVRDGTLPGPIPGKRRWDRKAIDLAMDKRSGLKSASGAFGAWRAGHESENARR